VPAIEENNLLRFVSKLACLIARRWQPSGRWAADDAGQIGYEDFRALPATALRAKLASDPREAARWLRAGARHGFPEAQLMLGQMLLDGAGLDRDQPAALRWFRHAAATGLPDAMNMVGRCHELGWGTPPDPALAASWYRRAAERGLDWGQYNLANLLLRGRGVPRDRRAAFEWYRRAAAAGHAKSMNLVGRFLEEGWDVTPDPVAAAEWYRRSAEAGDFRGQFNFAVGLVSRGNLGEAHTWFHAAIANGSRDFVLAAGEYLSGQAEPRLRELGQTALARCSLVLTTQLSDRDSLIGE
jgi:uncharacterized protein